MKILNYDQRDLILQNVRCTAKDVSTMYTKAQYRILCNLIKQKHITKQLFEFLLYHLYGLKDWKKLNYGQMYEFIHVLTFYDYEKIRM